MEPEVHNRIHKSSPPVPILKHPFLQLIIWQVADQTICIAHWKMKTIHLSSMNGDKCLAIYIQRHSNTRGGGGILINKK
jgi:hypothetical protein